MTTAQGRSVLDRLVDDSRMKYLGLVLVLTWHYTLWFVPTAFPATFLLDDRITFGWLTALTCTVITTVALALALGRTRHLPQSGWLLWTVSGLGCVATLTLTLGCGTTRGPLICYLASALIGICAGFLWVMWGERYACQRAQFTMGRLAPVYGIVLLAGLIAVYLLPGILAPILVCLMPVTSGLLLNLSWRKSQSVSFPPILTRNTTRHATLSIVIVCLISFIVAYVSYFVVAIVPWEDLWGVERSFTFGVGIGAILILVIGLAHARLQGKTTIFKLFPWILLFSLVACLLCLSSYPEDFTGFLLALTASSVLEVLVIMYMARLTLSGYTPSATAFGMSAAAIRFGILLGNGTALIYERIPGFQDLWTQPTLLVFVVVLAGLLIPLVRQEYSINDLTVAPVDASQWSTTLEGISKQFHLSARETEILELLGRGYTATAVAEKLIISPHTVNTHVQHIYEKMGIHRRSELLDYLNKG